MVQRTKVFQVLAPVRWRGQGIDSTRIVVRNVFFFGFNQDSPGADGVEGDSVASSTMPCVVLGDLTLERSGDIQTDQDFRMRKLPHLFPPGNPINRPIFCLQSHPIPIQLRLSSRRTRPPNQPSSTLVITTSSSSFPSTPIPANLPNCLIRAVNAVTRACN